MDNTTNIQTETPRPGRCGAWLDLVNSWLETWSPHCGAPRSVFEGQFRVTLREIFDEIERRAEANMLKTGKLEGMHYAALKDVRRELCVTRSTIKLSDCPPAAVVERNQRKQNEKEHQT